MKFSVARGFMFLYRAKFSIFFLLAIFSFTSFSQAQTPTPPPLDGEDDIKVFTEEVKLNISAFDETGKFVSDVKKEDLVIMEDDRLHQANSLRRIPANVLIVLDTGGEMRRAKGLTQTRKTAENLIRALKPEDSVAIMQYNDKVEIIAEWTDDKQEVLETLNSKINFGKRSLFLNAVDTATNFLQKTELDNRHLVLITDGTDTFNDKERRDALLSKLISTSISVHVISYTQMELKEIEPDVGVFRKGEAKPKRAPDFVIDGMPNGVKDIMRAPRLGSINLDKEFLKKMTQRGNDLVEGEEFLSTLAKDTNGQFVLPETKEEMLEKPGLIAKLIDSSYVITYTPKRSLSEAPNGEVRQVVVTSKRSGLEVQARRKITISREEKE